MYEFKNIVPGELESEMGEWERQRLQQKLQKHAAARARGQENGPVVPQAPA
jgi:hypothetical protein